MDPSTFRVMFDVRNNSGTTGPQLRPIGSPWAFFRRARLVSSSVIEDIDHNARCHEMLHTLTSKQSRQNDYSEAFGEELTIIEDILGNSGANNHHGIPGNQSQDHY